MSPRRRSGERGTRSGARRRPKTRAAPARRAKPDPRFFHHSAFGNIPLLPVLVTDASGGTREILKYDPDYAPPLPPGAVRGDVRKQSFCPLCDVPKYFYVGESRTCVQCGASFLFGAAEQKHWYETLQFRFESTAVRCVACRRRRRTEGAFRAQIAAAKSGLRSRAADPGLLLSLAEATARLHQLSGAGKLEEAIAAARRAFKRWPEGVEALFWEALCQAESGRPAKARALFAEFVKSAPSGKRLGPLVREAQAFLADGSRARGTT
jgi:tetratricopeptide (TPR) repeat protein